MSLKVSDPKFVDVSDTVHEPADELRCRICGQDTFEVLNLGYHPFANRLVTDTSVPINTYPLALYVCTGCAAAQLSYCADSKELYEDYNYITPKSDLLTQHYGYIVDFLTERGYLNQDSNLVEIGSNIGRFLSFVQPEVQSVLGIDPAANIVQKANELGIPTIADFFNVDSARKILRERGKQDIVVARHCFAHNEKPWKMLEGVVELLSHDGIFVIENAYFLDTIQNHEFDQIYHEHMYYHSLRSIREIANLHGMELVDVYHSPIHGGTVVYVTKFADSDFTISKDVEHYLALEADLHKPEYYRGFREQVETNRRTLRTLIGDLTEQGKVVHAYGASAKSTTLLNYYGLTHQSIPYVVDSTVTKQGKYLPLANIHVISEETAQKMVPDYYLLTIWNYKDEIIKKVRDSGNHHTRFILPHPVVTILED